MEAHYRTLATILLAACPPGVERAWIEASLGDGHVRAQYHYQQGEARGQPTIDAAGSFGIAQALTAVRDAWPTDPKWNDATFTVFPDGRFKMDVADAGTR